MRANIRILLAAVRTWWRIKFHIDSPLPAWHREQPAVKQPREYTREEKIDVMNQALGARPTTGVRIERMRTWEERTGIPGFKLDRDRYS